MTSPQNAFADFKDLRIEVPEGLQGACASLTRIAEPRQYAFRLFQAGFANLGNIHGRTVGEIQEAVPTTPENLRRNIALLVEAGVKIARAR